MSNNLVNKYAKFTIYLWVVNFIIYALSEYLPKGYLNLTNLRAVVNVIFIGYLFLNNYVRNVTPVHKAIYLFLLYLLILSIFSSNRFLSFSMTIKVAIGTLMFAIGYQFFKDYDAYKFLLKYYLFVLIVVFLTFLYSGITGIGNIDYSEDGLLYGGFGVSIVKTFILILAQGPLFYNILTKKSRKRMIFVLLAITLIFVLVSMKRGGLLALLSVVIVFLIYYKIKLSTIMPITALILVLYLTSFIYKDTLVRNFESREKRMYGFSQAAESFEDEARYNETALVIDALMNNGIKHAIFGSELFNEFKFFKTNRMLHIDLNVILNGSGILGLFLLLRIYYLIFSRANFYLKVFRLDFRRKVAISVIAVIISLQFIAISGSIRAIDYRGLIFLFLGASLGFLENEYIKLKLFDKENNKSNKYGNSQ